MKNYIKDRIEEIRRWLIRKLGGVPGWEPAPPVIKQVNVNLDKISATIQVPSRMINTLLSELPFSYKEELMKRMMPGLIEYTEFLINNDLSFDSDSKTIRAELYVVSPRDGRRACSR